MCTNNIYFHGEIKILPGYSLLSGAFMTNDSNVRHMISLYNILQLCTSFDIHNLHFASTTT